MRLVVDARDRRAIKTLIDRRVRLLRADDPPERKTYSKRAMVTESQLEVLRFAALGFSTAQVATFTGRSRETVKSHQKHALQRLEARTVTQAVAIAYRQGLLWPVEADLEEAA